MSQKIKGGFYLKARAIQKSKISNAPPYIREIWDWLLCECNHKEEIVGGRKIKRGQCLRSFKDIQDDLCWYVGYRKEAYKKWHCEKAMKWLMREDMIVTTKTTRGMFIEVLNYSFYQDPKNYESNNRATKRATTEQQTTDTINNTTIRNNKKKEDIYVRIAKFKKQVEDYVAEHPKYKPILKDFLEYWTAMDDDKTKFRKEDGKYKYFQMGSRLATFLKNYKEKNGSEWVGDI